ncbi:MAG TPA: tetratricopeptide repeat protein [Candidatus Eisenbacteria bacterium]|nr:tetratricopeptide repeat protein [Candidatus Eisenbacteria bacterium]
MGVLCRLITIVAFVALASSSANGEDEAAARNGAGVKLLQEGKIEAAIVEFQKAASLNPKYLPARLNLAYAYQKGHRTEEAISEYQRALELEPGNFFAHNNLGVLYDQKGRYDEAIAAFQRALESEPGNVMALKNLETAQKNKATIAQRDGEIQRLEREALQKPKDPEAAYYVARAYAAIGKKDQANEWLEKALKLGYRDFDYLKADPAFKEMRDDRDFQLLLIKNGR